MTDTISNMRLMKGLVLKLLGFPLAKTVPPYQKKSGTISFSKRKVPPTDLLMTASTDLPVPILLLPVRLAAVRTAINAVPAGNVLRNALITPRKAAYCFLNRRMYAMAARNAIPVPWKNTSMMPTKPIWSTSLYVLNPVLVLILLKMSGISWIR